MQNKLLIWDFDGVIADSEYLWVKNWVNALHTIYHLDLSIEEQKQFLEGKADKTKVESFQKIYPDMKFQDDFWNYLRQQEDILIANELQLTPNILDILEDKNFNHCIATGSNEEKHFKKIHHLKLDKYFNNDNSFTAYMVKSGKPAPDIFLYSAEKMGYKPEDCLIIEDSIAGIKAGKSANIPLIAYIGATGHNNSEYAEKCLKEGAFAVSDNMPQIHKLIRQHFNL